jgi:hypothetical protein
MRGEAVARRKSREDHFGKVFEGLGEIGAILESVNPGAARGLDDAMQHMFVASSAERVESDRARYERGKARERRAIRRGAS